MNSTEYKETSTMAMVDPTTLTGAALCEAYRQELAQIYGGEKAASFKVFNCRGYYYIDLGKGPACAYRLAQMQALLKEKYRARGINA
jgi:hypothetical protein